MKLLRINHNNIIVLATILLLFLLYAVGSIRYTGFFSMQVFLNLFIDNAYLIIVATGMAFVIISGGIDLSVASVVALITMVSGMLFHQGAHPYTVIAVSLAIGVMFGASQGYLISRFKLHPWIVTLAGMFLARGISYLISTESIVITDPTYNLISQYKIRLGGGNFISISVVIAICVVVLALFVGKYTAFGRAVYALGGSEKSAVLMGLPVARTTVLVYTLCGFCSALGGIVFTFYTLSGYSLHLMGMEMDAIAACVIGGILLTGGFGYFIGPMLGVLCTGIIQTIIMFQGTLSSWWTKIAIGFLLFLFMALQRMIVMRKEKEKTAVAKSQTQAAQHAGNL
ncbi:MULTISPECIES: galactofuranose ABC transporter, permease protein YjfF [unclassified Paenibacillus]|uniref:galactofuranose ABC transporter, permease protein YjfF n=1 Tax=unclassified Paenibacillus TaxID=185978 RepID=UPI001C104E63|nr:MULTISPECIES: galactofuranose ABC transporter, permease protein YjfF [unclassified Paenibacillus]MBU5442165.1 sugar ABC transporter permease YjfF [Paenibacillus sp. MSJ-34]CAH0118910.1 Inner membrane ABC transporter permease protein YjfF [Paenibacillus sp. CECT 9249]